MESERDILKVLLADKLIINRVFWSYVDIKAEDISDEILIEKVLIYLDIEDINSLFLIYPYKKIRDIWRREIIIQEPLYHSLNLLLAFLYFHIENPEKYIQRISQRRLISI